jgi:perosamine synthetase
MIRARSDRHPAGDDDLVARYKRRIQSELEEPCEVSLFWKGRVALYAILRACGLRDGDEVIIPAFTCVAVPNAILYLGARPVYADISPETYTIDPASVAARIGPRTRAILAQNTFGLAPDLDPLMELARAHRLWLIEDCAHGFGGRYRGRPNGTIADASFFSTQWSKPFSTGLGGIAVTRDERLCDRLRALEESAASPSLRERMILDLLARARRRFVGPRSTGWLIEAYRWLGRTGVVVGSSSAGELGEPVRPARFELGSSTVQARLGLDELADFRARLQHRAEMAAHYRERLLALGVPLPTPPSYATHTWLKFAVRVRRREQLLAEARRAQLEVGDWFVSPLHPIREHFEWWHYRYGTNPVAEAVSREIVNLPTHEGIDEAYVDRLFNRLDFRSARG